MVRFGQVVVMYFVIGAVLWGGGIVGWDNAGVGTVFISDPATGAVNESVASQVTNADTPLRNALNAIGGGAILALWDVIQELLALLFWPVQTLDAVGAPPRITVLVGGTNVVAFFAGLLLFIKGSG